MRRSKRIWGFERLECRSLLTGTVTVTVNVAPQPWPTLVIRGDGNANAIVIHETKSNGNTIAVKVEGINTKIVGREYFESFSFGLKTSVFSATDIDIKLGGGNDTLRIYDTNVPGTLNIDMGSGNDTLRMTNVQFSPYKYYLGSPGYNPPTISLGMGNDLAILRNVNSTQDVDINAGLGHDTVKLDTVSAGTFQSGNTLHVDMGPGKNDRLQVIESSADHGIFNDSDTGGILLNRGQHVFSSGRVVPIDALPNHFTDETDSGFQEFG